MEHSGRLVHVVQFLHPGGEDKRGEGEEKSWSKGGRGHHRKFIVQSGKCLSGARGQTAYEGAICFWAEWEAEAEVEPVHSTEPNGPTCRFYPFWRRPLSYAGLMNTDPFVFGEHFYYSNCQQSHLPGLKKLERGSVILFGSCIGREFALDTVFVVADQVEVELTADTYETLRVSDTFQSVTLRPLFEHGPSCDGPCGHTGAADGVHAYRLYHGAPPDKPVEGMFSFFPCLPAESGRAFARPSIGLGAGFVDHFNSALTEGAKGCRAGAVVPIAAAKGAWQLVVDQVLERQLQLGVYAQLPAERMAPG